MMLHIPEVLSKVQVQQIRAELDTAAAWQNGQFSAGAQAQKIKQNLQFDLQHPSYVTLSQDILSALKQQALLPLPCRCTFCNPCSIVIKTQELMAIMSIVRCNIVRRRNVRFVLMFL